MLPSSHGRSRPTWVKSGGTCFLCRKLSFLAGPMRGDSSTQSDQGLSAQVQRVARAFGNRDATFSPRSVSSRLQPAPVQGFDLQPCIPRRLDRCSWFAAVDCPRMAAAVFFPEHVPPRAPRPGSSQGQPRAAPELHGFPQRASHHRRKACGLRAAGHRFSSPSDRASWAPHRPFLRVPRRGAGRGRARGRRSARSAPHPPPPPPDVHGKGCGRPLR